MIRKGINFRRSKHLTWDTSDGTVLNACNNPIPSNYVVLYRCECIWDWERDGIEQKQPSPGFIVMEESTRIAREKYGEPLTW